MTTRGWHLDDVAIDRYAHGDAGLLECHSIEAHFMRCAECRGRLNASAVSSGSRADRWDRVAEAIDRSGTARGLVPDLVRVTAASSLLAGATAAVVVVLVTAVVAAALDGSRGAFVGLLAVAPVLPVCLVIVAFRPAHDPAGLLAEATPLTGGRLPLVRSLVCSGTALASSALTSLVFPLPSGLLAAWLLPALAFGLIVLAISTWIDPVRIGIALACAWWVSIGMWSDATRRVPIEASLDRLAWTHSNVRLVVLAMAFAAAAVVWRRRDARPDWRAS